MVAYAFRSVGLLRLLLPAHLLYCALLTTDGLLLTAYY